MKFQPPTIWACWNANGKLNALIEIHLISQTPCPASTLRASRRARSELSCSLDQAVYCTLQTEQEIIQNNYSTKHSKAIPTPGQHRMRKTTDLQHLTLIIQYCAMFVHWKNQSCQHFLQLWNAGSSDRKHNASGNKNGFLVDLSHSWE